MKIEDKLKEVLKKDNNITKETTIYNVEYRWNEWTKLQDFIKHRFNTKTDKAIHSITKTVYMSMIFDCKSKGIPFDIKYLEEFFKNYNDNKILDISFIRKEGNLFDYINKKYDILAKELIISTPGGLGTPTAACGEVELMLFILSPKFLISKKRGEGDVIIASEKIEIKAGTGPRIWGKISGIEARERIKKIAELYNFKPNKAISKGCTYFVFEPWSKVKKKREHWSLQFQKVGIHKSKKFISEVINALNCSFSVEKCFPNKKFDVVLMNTEMLKSWFKNISNSVHWDKLIYIDENYSIHVITRNIKEFNTKVDNGEIVADVDFIRIFQDSKIGMYWKHTVI